MPQDDRGRGARHPSADPGGVAHHHHDCLWATLPGSISAWSLISWSLRFAELTRGYRAMKPPASLPARPATGICCGRLPLDGGRAGSRDATRGFLAGVEASGFTSRYPPVMPQDDRGRCARHPSVDPGGVAHGHHGCLWATLPGSISAWSSIPWSLRFAEMTRGYRAMKPLASLSVQPATGIS